MILYIGSVRFSGICLTDTAQELSCKSGVSLIYSQLYPVHSFILNSLTSGSPNAITYIIPNYGQLLVAKEWLEKQTVPSLRHLIPSVLLVPGLLIRAKVIDVLQGHALAFETFFKFLTVLH